MVKFLINCGIIHRDFACNLFLSKIKHNILFSHKGMRKILLITFLILFFVTGIEAQLQNKSNAKDIKSTDLVIGPDGLHRPAIPGQFSITFSGVGPAYLFGDPGVLKNPFLGILDFRIFDTSILYSVGLQHIFPNNVGIKADAFYGTFSGTDEGEGSKYPTRGYSFQSTLYEFAIQGEYIFLGGPFSKRSTPHTFYVYAGAGLMYSDATTKLHGDIINYPSENPDFGQPRNFSPVLPFGLGYQFRLTSKFSLGAEFGYHYIFSDYIDGISTEEGINYDVLAAFTFTFTYKLYESGKIGESGQSMKNRCNCVWQ